MMIVTEFMEGGSLDKFLKVFAFRSASLYDYRPYTLYIYLTLHLLQIYKFMHCIVKFLIVLLFLYCYAFLKYCCLK